MRQHEVTYPQYFDVQPTENYYAANKDNPGVRVPHINMVADTRSNAETISFKHNANAGPFVQPTRRAETHYNKHVEIPARH